MVSKQEEVRITVPQLILFELRDLMTKITYPDVTYNEDKLVMAEHAVRKSRLYAEKASDILNGVLNGN